MVGRVSMIRLNELDQIPATMPCPYNGTKVSNDQLETFISASLNQEKLPMVILGANWCPDAQCLEAVMQLPSVAQFIAEHYEVIRVDLGEYDINMDLIECLGMPSQEGIPRVLFWTSRVSRLILRPMTIGGLPDKVILKIFLIIFRAL